VSLDWIAGSGRPLRGRLRVPGDKSVSHRALLLAAIAEGTSTVEGFLEGDDTLATARILGQLGVRIEAPAPGKRVVHGVGLRGLRGTAETLDCGNAGTGMRLLCGLLAGQGFESRLDGDASLRSRPMTRVIAPLERMGARIDAGEGGRAPLRIHANNVLQSIEYEPEVASAQLKSAVLLAALYARGRTTVREPQATRDYTERMLRAFGVVVDARPGFAAVDGGARLTATHVDVPADFSSAAFFLVAASLVPGSDLVLERVGINPRRTGLLHALRAMGADITEEATGEQGGEPVADLRVRSAPLHGIELPVALVPDMIDEVPVFMVAAALAHGPTRIRGAAELRVKESDRLAAMASGLAALGVPVVEHPDGADLPGGARPGPGAVATHGDHRIAMSFAVAAQCASGDVRIADCAHVATSFPGFLAMATDAGFGLAPDRIDA
jgi:3-phosphoshikimate 1-carboxyvinyltransferase